MRWQLSLSSVEVWCASVRAHLERSSSAGPGLRPGVLTAGNGG